jgi:ribose 5-phosphate isomerase A
VDGADEVDPHLDLIKGWGGALARERIVAAASTRQIILVGREKLVPVLGTRGQLPVEVLPFALPWCCARLERLDCRPRARTTDGGQPFVTDNGNSIIDCAVGPIADPPALDRAIRGIPGVVEVGLFLGMAHTVLVADGSVIRTLERRSLS